MIKLLAIFFWFHTDTTIIVNVPNRNDTIILTDTSKLTSITTDTSTLLPIIFLCGQSNMEGGDLTGFTPCEFTGKINNAFVFYKPDSTSANNGSIQTFEAGVNNNTFDAGQRLGPEAGIAYYITKAGKKIGIVKYARRGSQLVNYATNVNGIWQTNSNRAPFQYKIFINNYAKPSLNAFAAAGFRPYVAAFVWCQGETDAQTSDTYYQSKLTLLIDTLKYDLRPLDAGIDTTMRIIIVRTHIHAGGSHLSAIRTAQMNVGNTYNNAQWIDSDSWPRISDNIHYTRTSQATLFGKAVADICIPLIK